MKNLRVGKVLTIVTVMAFFVLLFASLITNTAKAEGECDYFEVNQKYLVSDFKKSNMASLTINYIGNLNDRLEGPSVTTNGRTRYFTGSIPIYDVVDGWAYFPSKTDIYKLPIEHFSNLFAVSDDSYVLAAYRTIYFDSIENRKYNIRLVSSIIDGTVIRAGATFSYNSVTGPRGKKEGYKVAKVIKNGEYVDDYGGGVCQVSSTIHAAVMNNPNFQIVKRSPHGLSVSYLPEGMDATVAYPSTDFCFKNNYPFDVVIHIHSDEGACIVTITRTE